MYETFDGRGNFHGLHHRLFIAVTVPSANLIQKLPAKHELLISHVSFFFF